MVTSEKVDSLILKFFNQFRETVDEMIMSDSLCSWIINNLDTDEKYIFWLRVGKGYSFYQIQDHLNISYRQAQNIYQKVSNKIYQGTAGRKIFSKEKLIMTEPFFNHDDRIILYNDDCRNITSYLDPESVDLCITSPPYNVGINYGEYRDVLDDEVYLKFSEEWIASVYKALKPDGRCFINVPIDCCYKDGEKATYVDIVNIARSVGLKYHGTIIWRKNHVANRFCTGTKYSAKAPITNHQSECIIIMYKETWDKTSGSGVSSIAKEDWWKLTDGTWTFPGQDKKSVKHPAPFPVKLPLNCINMFSYVDDVIIDPFVGSGTTLVACALSNRIGIGFDIDSNYLETAKHRIIKEGNVNQGQLFDVLETYGGD